MKPIGVRELGPWTGQVSFLPDWEGEADPRPIPGIDEIIEFSGLKLRVVEIEWDDCGDVHLTARCV